MDLHFKSVGLAFVLSALILMFSLIVGSRFYSEQSTPPIEQIQNDSTSDNLAIEFNDKLPDLIYNHVFSFDDILYDDLTYYILTKNIDGEIDERVYPNDTRFDISTNWYINTGSQNQPITSNIDINYASLVIDNLHTSLIGDIDFIQNYSQVYGDPSEIIDDVENLGNGMSFEVLHIYQDGSSISIQTYGQEVLIFKMEVDLLILRPNGWAITFNTSTAEFFRGTFNSDPFDSYKNAIYDMLSQFLDQSIRVYNSKNR